MFDKNKKHFSNNRNQSQQNIREDVKIIKKEPLHTCDICKKPIQFISESLISKSKEGYVHFDCAINEISKSRKLEKNMKVSYIGAGKFGIIEYIKHPNSFKIIETIEWEDSDSTAKIKNDIEELKK